MADRLADGELFVILCRMKARGDSNDTIAKRLYAEHGIDLTSQTISNWWATLSPEEDGAA